MVWAGKTLQSGNIKPAYLARHWWLMPVILATQEVSQFEDSLGK
jgi:hypothetical protein